MKRKGLKIDINNDYIKLYLRLLKEEEMYSHVDFLSHGRYDNVMNEIGRGYKQNTMKWIIGIPDLLISTDTHYDDYYNIHSKYMFIIFDDILTTSLKTIYQILPSDELKSNLNKNRKLIKEDIKKQFIAKVNKRNLSGNFFAAFVSSIHNILLRYDITHKSITPRNINDLLTKKRKYKLIKKN